MLPKILATIRRALVPALAAVLLSGTLAAAPAAPAAAAVPDQWGFAYLHTPTPAFGTVMDPTRQWGGWKATAPGLWATVQQGAVGRYRVIFPLTAARNGVAHVTAISNAPRWCQVFRTYPSGSDQVVEVQCYRHGGAPDNSRFAVMFASSSGRMAPAHGAYAYVSVDMLGNLLTSYNSVGAANVTARLSAGVYLVRLPGIGTGLMDGNLQVTAEHPNSPRRCKVARWGPDGRGYYAYVFCFDENNRPADSWFNLTYHRERAVFGGLNPPLALGYLWSPALGSASDFNSSGAMNIVINSGAGLNLVVFPQVGVRETHVQVTAFGDDPDYCGLQEVWQVSGSDVYVRNVICFDAFSGGPAREDYFITYSSRV